jgi:hypothetical protein
MEHNWGGGGHMTHIGEKYNAQKSSVGKPEGKKTLKRPILVGRMILKRVLRNMVRCREQDLYDSGKNNAFLCAR